jgi:hypothetical protein
MDVTIKEALDASRVLLECRGSGTAMPSFTVDPL